MTPNHNPKYIPNQFWECAANNLVYYGDIMNIPMVAKVLSRLGWEYELVFPLVTTVYRNKGDVGVILLFYEMTGIHIDNISRGKYIMTYQKFT